RRAEFYWAVIAAVGVVVLGTLRGILVAVLASLAWILHQAQDPPVYTLGRKRGTNVLLLRTEGRIYFGNAERAGEKMWPLIQDAAPRVVVLDLSAVADLEYSVLR